MKRMWNNFLNLFPHKCADCEKEMKRNDLVIRASCGGIGVYYEGSGICYECSEKRFEDALANKED